MDNLWALWSKIKSTKCANSSDLYMTESNYLDNGISDSIKLFY